MSNQRHDDVRGEESSGDVALERRWPPCIEVIDDATAEMYRRMSPQQRVRACLEMYDMAWQIVANSIRDREPNISEAELRSRVVARMRDAG